MDIKPTFSKPISPISKGYQKGFDKSLSTQHVKLNEFDLNNQLNEIDALLTENEFSLKKKIFSLAKMEALVFSDPKLSAVYEEMSAEGEFKFGYHYNETIMNMLFNDYVLNSPKYLQKYKQAVPKEKKRRDKSGINQLKKTGEKMQTRNLVTKPEPKPVTEEQDDNVTEVLFLVNEKDPKDPDLFAYFPEENYDNKGILKMGYSHIGQHSAVHPSYVDDVVSREATPKEYAPLKAELESLGYNLHVLNSMEETTGAGGAAGGAFSGSGQYSAPLGYEKKNLAEFTMIGGEPEQNVDTEAEDEPQDDDCYIQSDGNKYSVSCNGKFLKEFIEMDDALAAVKAWKDANNWYPNTWFVSDHGNFSLIDDEGNILKEGTTSGSVGGPAGGSGAYYGPAMWGKGDLLPAKGEAPVKKKPAWKGGTIIQENYLVETEGFEKFFNALSEEDLSYQNKLGKAYEKSHTKSNKGLGVSEIPQPPARAKKKEGIDNNTSLYIGQDIDKMRDDDVKILHNDMTKKNSYFPHKDNPNLPDDGIAGTIKEETMEEVKKIDEKAKSKEQQRLFGMAHAVQKGELPASKVGGAVKKIAKDVSPKDVEDFAKTKHKGLPEKKKSVDENINSDDITFTDFKNAIGNNISIDEIKTYWNNFKELLFNMRRNNPNISDSEVFKIFMKKNNSLEEETQTMIGDNPESMSNKAVPVGQQSGNIDMGVRSTGGGSMSESVDLLEQINNELKAFSIHQEKLKKMTEDRKPSALILRDRVGGENEKNFKKDLKDSSIEKIVDIENSLEWKDQQTEVKDPHELAEKLEKGEVKAGDMKSGEALKDVGDSANDKGDEIPKRNMTEEEAEEVKKYKLNLKDYVYDNEPGKRFEDRMKKDMGEENYKQRQENLKFRGKQPMYNKDSQPTAPTTADKVQFDKEQTGWNERVGLKEAIVTGRFVDALGKKHIMDFRLNETKLVSGDAKFIEPLFQLDFTGFGNKYESKTQGKKVVVNESVEAILSECKYYTNGKDVFAVKNPVQKLNENEQKTEKPVVNEQMNKMKHLVDYNTKDFLKQSKIL